MLISRDGIIERVAVVAGNLLTDNTHGYAYDAENRLTCVVGTDGTCTSASATLYLYDADGQRVGKQQANTLEDYVYDPQGHISSVHDGSGNLLRTELYSPDGRHVSTLNGNTWNTNYLFWNHADWLGTERVRTNFSGAVAETCTDTPYGMNLNCVTQGDTSPMHFTGKQRDYETGLDYFGARYYGGGNSLGRFMTPDPLGRVAADLGNPQTWNMYAYVRNNPLTFTDPTGLCPDTVTGKDTGHGFWWCVGHALGITETQNEYDARIANERNWLINNAAQNASQVSALRGASASQIDTTYKQWDRAIQNAQCPWYATCEVQPYSASAFYRNASGALVLYRGGPGFELKPGEVKLDAQGNVKTTRGPSLNEDPAKVEKFGGAYEVKYLPPELQVVSNPNNPGHWEIVPREPGMSLERFQELLDQIIREPAEE